MTTTEELPMDKLRMESPNMTAQNHRPHCCHVSELHHVNAE